jgi:hypothetical protein
MKSVGEYLYLNSPSNPKGNYFFLLDPPWASKRITKMAAAVMIASISKVYPVESLIENQSVGIFKLKPLVRPQGFEPRTF